MIVVAALAGSLALLTVLVAAALVTAWLQRLIRKHGAGAVFFRFISGRALDGVARTNSTFTRASHGPRPVLTPTGHAHRWHHLPDWQNTGIRLGAVFAFAATIAGLILAPVATGITLAVLFAAGLLVAAWRLFCWLRTWHHNRHYVRPLEGTLVRRIPTAPSSITVERDGDAVKQVAIEWPAETELDAGDQQAVLQAVTARLAIEAPNAAWKLKGRDRSVRFTPCDRPPPASVSWDDVSDAIRAAAPNALVFGAGKKDAITKATYSESPHIAIPGSSGGGKSNLAALLLLQEMIRGSLIFNLDPKWISHLWMQGLPNVINAHDIPDLHLALEWLGRELNRRTRAAHASANGTGRVRGNVGPRIIVVAEELNFGMPGLKNHWREIRTKEDPKKSPALEGLSALSCAGRASDMHELLIAQMLTAESTGANDSTIRGNCGIKAMARWDTPGWNMVVGKHIPMPPQTTAPGRIQLVTGQTVRETQVPYLHLDDKDEEVADKAVTWARELAVSGAVAQIPTGPAGIPAELWPAVATASVLDDQDLSRPALPAGQGPVPVVTRTDGEVVAEPLKLSEIVDLGLVPGMTLDALRKASLRWDDFPQPAGHEGPANTYNPDEVAECVQSHRQTLRVVS